MFVEYCKVFNYIEFVLYNLIATFRISDSCIESPVVLMPFHYSHNNIFIMLFHSVIISACS